MNGMSSGIINKDGFLINPLLISAVILLVFIHTHWSKVVVLRPVKILEITCIVVVSSWMVEENGAAQRKRLPSASELANVLILGSPNQGG